MADKEQVIQALRATLISVKGALTIKQCNRDYKELQGEWIPFKKLGYPTLEKLFLDVQGFKVNQINGEWYVDAVASQETQHLVAMVAKQKSSKKPGPKLRMPSRFPKRQDSWRKPMSSSNYSNSYNNQYSNQFYRARGDPAYSHINNYTAKFTGSYNRPYSTAYKPNETRPVSQYTKTTKTVTEYPGTVSAPPTLTGSQPITAAPPPVSKLANHHIPSAPKQEQPKPLLRIEVENGVRHSKVSASQRLSNLRDRLNTDPHLIPLQLPAVTNECLDTSGSAAHVALAHQLEPPPDSTSTVAKLEWTCQKLGLPPPVYKVQDHKQKRGPVNYDCSVKYTSGSATHVALVHQLEPPPDSTSAVAKLEWTCQKLGLPPPVYKVQDHKQKRGPVNYDCSVKVGSKYSASSYPDSSPSDAQAREVAALKLLDAIESSETPGLATAGAARAVAGLQALVADHAAGIWASTVPHLYREKYEENLPSNWQELLENCPRIRIERVVNGLSVLLPNDEETPAPFIDTTISIMDDTIDSELPPLQFPEENFWNVYVTVANSTIEIWVRIVGLLYSDAFELLLKDMAKHYDRYGTSVEKSMILINAWYAVNLEDGGWQRAKILEICDDNAIVFLGDHGDDDQVSLDKIKILEPQFRKIPAQAILCRMEGAEELAACAAATELVQKRLVGETLVAAPGPRDDPADPAVKVVLYDTTTQRDLNLNKEIIHDFCTAGAFTITQKLCEVQVGCVTEEGRVWVARAEGAAAVRGALALLTPGGAYRRPLPASPPAPPPPPPAAQPPPLYIVRTLDGDWVRCTIISGLDGEGTVRTQLVDSGLILRAPLSSLVPLANFSPALNAFPPQAVQVRLGPAERVACHMTSRLRELLLKARVVCRALPAPPAAPAGPHPAFLNVELFVRTGPQNILASVNNAITVEYECLQLGKQSEEEAEPTDHVEALHRKKERIFRSVSAGGAGAGAGAGEEGALRRPRPGGALPPPALPAVGKCLDVHIAMAANPWNFVVQPNSTRHTLQAMMASLQEECPKLSESDAPHNPASGELYTVLYEKDNSWYRITIAGEVSKDMVSGYFCDFGDLALFANKSLRPVPAAVPLARSLPQQAIKARLYDVWPLHQDWTVEDCIRFNELCVEQQFVGICKEVGRDPLNPSEPLLTLDLIDTSTDEDVYLNKQLVAEGRARLGPALQS